MTMTTKCRNCNRVLGEDGHPETDCSVNQPRVETAGACLKCGSWSLYPYRIAVPWSIETLDPDGLVKCAACGLIASETA